MTRVFLLSSQVNPQTSAHPSKTYDPFSTLLPSSVHTSATVPITLRWEFLFRCQLLPSDRKLLGGRGHDIHLCFPSTWATSGLITVNESSSISQAELAAPSSTVVYIPYRFSVYWLARYRGRAYAFISLYPQNLAEDRWSVNICSGK